MSDPRNAFLPSEETGDTEFTLAPPLRTLLREGLHALPAPNARPNFNDRALAHLTSGRDLDDWPRQLRRRLRWMLFPLVLGYGVTYSLALHQTRALPARAPIARIERMPTAPPLPALPKDLLYAVPGYPRPAHQPAAPPFAGQSMGAAGMGGGK